MVGEVAGDDVYERPHGDRIVAGHATTGPRLGRKSVQKRDGRSPDGLEFLDQLCPRGIVSMSVVDGDVLVKTRERVLKTTGEPESTAEEYTLPVVNMV